MRNKKNIEIHNMINRVLEILITEKNTTFYLYFYSGITSLLD